VVEELFPDVPTTQWDLLLDLRGELLHGDEWEQVLEQFQQVRDALEADHYLVFFRLRRLLESHLRLEVVAPGGNEVHRQLLKLWSYRTLAHALRRTRRKSSDVGSDWICRVVEHSV
jgi:hypothetical protein